MTSFARLHGDQFAILLGSVADRHGAAGVAARLLESLSQPLTVQDRQFSLAARVGIATFSQKPPTNRFLCSQTRLRKFDVTPIYSVPWDALARI